MKYLFKILQINQDYVKERQFNFILAVTVYKTELTDNPCNIVVSWVLEKQFHKCYKMTLAFILNGSCSYFNRLN